MSYTHGPLPQWEIVGGYGSGTYEAEDRHGIVWRLWLVEQPADGDPLPPGYRLAPRDHLTNFSFITREYGLYHALDTAGMQIAADAARDDPEGAVRQLGLDGG
ncbi:hypothetical protein [Streptomyces sp. NBC_00582]|uniref:hypothetical protein n=1 Tax=Streptomyces sp. NBC_00582 TaxID=2975783 RepID=UPI002E7FFBE8|nr:hypothetical protein [Streptomyces sp. NBC_00582]WUB68589.1 hypothetical protein OG852_50720 [Streptomyces sp. NBC_00582]